MEQEKINIAALLDGCPKGTNLYSPICGECKLTGFAELSLDVTYPIVVEGEERHVYNFTKYGTCNSYGECLLFPSKKVRDWGCFKAKFAKGNNAKQILINNGGIDDGDIVECLLKAYYIDSVTNIIESFDGLMADEQNYILSTGTELKLEEEQPKFKVGDVVVRHDGIMADIFVVSEDELIGEATGHNISISDINEISAYHYTLATPEEIASGTKRPCTPTTYTTQRASGS